MTNRLDELEAAMAADDDANRAIVIAAARDAASTDPTELRRALQALGLTFVDVRRLASGFEDAGRVEAMMAEAAPIRERAKKAQAARTTADNEEQARRARYDAEAEEDRRSFRAEFQRADSLDSEARRIANSTHGIRSELDALDDSKTRADAAARIIERLRAGSFARGPRAETSKPDAPEWVGHVRAMVNGQQKREIVFSHGEPLEGEHGGEVAFIATERVVEAVNAVPGNAIRPGDVVTLPAAWVRNRTEYVES